MTKYVDTHIITQYATGAPQIGKPFTPVAYTFTAWVKASNVQGRVGWFYDVYKGHDIVVSNTLNADNALTGSSQVTEAITGTEGVDTVQVGTALYGTGTAYFDDAL